MKRFILILLLSTSMFGQAKSLYMISSYAMLSHKSVSDARIWHSDRVKGILASDEFYLGGTVLCVGVICFSAYYYSQEATLWEFTKTTASNLLIGSVIWDVVYGLICFNDPFYPHKNWYKDFGFKNHFERIAFDVIRLTAGIYLLIK